MKLESVTIENFRCFQNITLPLEGDVSVIVGVNGSGKTALLDAIAIALFDVVSAAPSKGARSRKSQRAEITALDRFTAPGVQLRYEPDPPAVKIGATVYRLDSKVPMVPWIAPKPVGRFEWKYSRVVKPRANAGNIEPAHDGLAPISIYMRTLWDQVHAEPSSVQSLVAIAYYRTNRAPQGVKLSHDFLTAEYDRVSAYESALNAGADAQAMYNWLYMVENLALRELGSPTNGQPKSSSPVVLAAMRSALKHLVDDVESFGFIGLRPTLYFRLKRDEKLLGQSLDQLSDGYRSLIGICLDFARRLSLANPNSEAPLSEPGILLIDEIELHLHPGWQQTVIPKLRQIFPNTQIIATTHSPQVLTSVESRCIRILDNFTLHSAPGGTWGAESKRVLEQVLQVDSRPPEDVAQPVKDLHLLGRLINEGNLEEAKDKLHELQEQGYADDPAVLRADITIENQLWERAHRK